MQYLRRPPALNQQWRLDRLLQRKAQEGVKVRRIHAPVYVSGLILVPDLCHPLQRSCAELYVGRLH